MSLLEVIQWLCHDCSCETQLVPSAGVFSRCRQTNGGFNVGKRWRGRHLLSWRHRCGSTYGFPDGHPGVLTAPLGLLPQGFLVNLLLSSWLGEEGLCWQPGAAGPLLLTVTGPAGCGAQGSCLNWPPVPSPWPWSCGPTCSGMCGARVVSCALVGNVIVAVSSLQGERWFPILVNQAAFSSTEFQQAF